jgi:hypothetical protein
MVGPDAISDAVAEVAVYVHPPAVIEGTTEGSSGMEIVAWGPHSEPPVPWQESAML